MAFVDSPSGHPGSVSIVEHAAQIWIGRRKIETDGHCGNQQGLSHRLRDQEMNQTGAGFVVHADCRVYSLTRSCQPGRHKKGAVKAAPLLLTEMVLTARA